MGKKKETHDDSEPRETGVPGPDRVEKVIRNVRAHPIGATLVLLFLLVSGLLVLANQYFDLTDHFSPGGMSARPIQAHPVPVREAGPSAPAASLQASCSEPPTLDEAQEAGVLRLGDPHLMELGRRHRVHRFKVRGAGRQSSVTAQDLTPNGNLNLCMTLEATDPRAGTMQSRGRIAELRFDADAVKGSIDILLWSATDSAGQYRVLLDDDFSGPADLVEFGRHKFGQFQSRSELHRYAFEGYQGDHLSVIAHDPFEEDGTLQPHVEVFVKEPETEQFDLVESGWRSSTFSVNTSLPSDGSYRVFLKDRLGGIGAYLLCVDKTNGLLEAQAEAVGARRRSWLPGVKHILPGLSALGLLAFADPGVRLRKDLEIVFVVGYNDGRPEEILRIKDRSSIDLSSESGELVRIFGRVSDLREKKVEITIERASESPKRPARPGDAKRLTAGDRVPLRFHEVEWLELGDVVASDRGGGGGGAGGGSCCVMCGGATLCGCAVIASCGSCCDACCGPVAK